MLKFIFQALLLHSRLLERRQPVTKEQKNLLRKTQELLLLSLLERRLPVAKTKSQKSEIF
jgi:hypothetical protein